MYYQHDARAMYQRTMANERADAVRGRWPEGPWGPARPKVHGGPHARRSMGARTPEGPRQPTQRLGPRGSHAPRLKVFKQKEARTRRA